MKNKVSLILLCGIILLVLCGCSNEGKEISDNKNLPLYDTNSSTGDKQEEIVEDYELKEDIDKNDKTNKDEQNNQTIVPPLTTDNENKTPTTDNENKTPTTDNENKTPTTDNETESNNDEEKINAIEVSIENWNTYFEFADTIKWDYNDFNEIDGMSIRKVIKLKSNYYGKIADDSKIAFEVSGVVIDKILITDYPNKKYTLISTNDGGTLGDGIDKTETISLKLSRNNYKNEASIYWCHDGYYMNEDKKIISINVIEQLKMNRVQGTIYLYD